MGYTDIDSSASKKSTPHFKPIVPAPHSRGLIATHPSSILSTLTSPLTPDPSPTMTPEDPKYHSHRRRDSGSTATSPTAAFAHEHSRNSAKGHTTAGYHLPTFGDLSKTAAPSSTSSSPSSSSRPLHTLYPNGTPPMSPGHVLISPVPRPHYGITDPSQYSSSSSSGFYQLPPPLQPFAPRQSPHQSPAIQPQSSQGHFLPPLPPLPSSAHSTNYSPRSTPQMSPLPNHYMVSPAMGPLSPYPTPQHQPRHFSSPHSDSMAAPKQSIPAMILPASALSSSSGAQEAASRSYSTILPHRDHSELSSPATAPVADHSAPSSPRRFMMLPPQSTPASSSTQRTSRSQTRKDSANTATSTTTTPTRRRASSNSKLVDQETRDLLRKVSHSAIERRRRERINDKILQLKHLVPACVDEDHLHKLSILQSTIEYIQHLKAILPASVANAKVGRATNSNPNNKTTDMLEAMGGSISSKSPLTPLMTTGLNHIYEKRIRVEKQEIRDLMKEHSPRNLAEEAPLSASSSSSPSSSDEDAKDGLLLLAGAGQSMEIPQRQDQKRVGRRKGSQESGMYD